MFSYVFMKLLELRPPSYDQRIDRVSGGHIRAVKEAIASEVPEGARVLEIGCGTGELASMLISRGATVEGFDLSPSMVEAARKRIETEGLGERFKVRQMGVEGIDTFPASTCDAVVSTLVFSEFNDDERRFALKHSERVLKPGGVIMIADEVLPRTRGRRFFHTLVRASMLALTYLVTQASTKPIEDLPGEMIQSGFTVEREERSQGDSFALVIGRRRAEKEVP